MTMRGGLRPCSAQGASIGCSQKANHAPPPHHFKPPSAKGEGLFQRPSHPGSEPVQQAFKIVEFHVGPVALARAPLDLIKQIACPAIDILALQQVVLRPRAAPLTGLAAQRVGLRLSRRAVLLALPTRVLLFRHRLAHVAHALAQRLHGVGLIVYGPGQIVVAQRLLGPFHRPLSPFQRLARGLSGLAAQARQALPLALQLAAQRLLPVGQFTFGTLSALTLISALLTFAALALLLAALSALPGHVLVALAPALAAALALIALRLAGLRPGVELFLQIAERLIREALLFAQRLCKAFHRLLPRRLALLALALGDLHIFHHLLEFFQRLLRLGETPLFHQLLDAVHHVLQILAVHLHHVLGALLIAAVVGVFALRLLHLLAQVILRGVAQFLHQPGDLLLAGIVLHRLAQTLLRGAHPLQRVAHIAIFQQNAQIPQRLRDLVPLIAVKDRKSTRLNSS